jgi:hypothetical protein
MNLERWFLCTAWAFAVIGILARAFDKSQGYAMPTYAMASACFFMLASIREKR